MSDLDPTVSEKLKKILDKDINELTDYDKDFLRARKDYIGKNSRERLADILAEPEQETKAREERVEEAKKEKEVAEEQSMKDQNAHLEPVVDEDEEDIEEDDEEQQQEAQAVG